MIALSLHSWREACTECLTEKKRVTSLQYLKFKRAAGVWTESEIRGTCNTEDEESQERLDMHLAASFAQLGVLYFDSTGISAVYSPHRLEADSY